MFVRSETGQALARPSTSPSRLARRGSMLFWSLAAAALAVAFWLRITSRVRVGRIRVFH